MADTNQVLDYEIYAKAPVVLCMLQFRYKRVSELDLKKIKDLPSDLRKEFPKLQENRNQTFKIQGTNLVGESEVVLDKSTVEGVTFFSKDNLRNIVVGVERTTLTVHGEYIGWENFEEAGRKMWETFSPKLGDVELMGISLRYVNRIDLPVDNIVLSDYFTAYLKTDIDEHFNTFQMRYSFFDPESSIKTHIAHGIESVIDDKVPYVFDIDVILLDETLSSENIWESFRLLRSEKNKIFNRGLTEKAKELLR